MRWIAIAVVSLVLTGSALAAGSEEQYLDVYNEILQADVLAQSGHWEAAALRYLQAQTDLQKLQAEHPTWNPDIVKFRLDYLAEKLQPLGKFLPATNAPPAAVPAPIQPSAAAQPAAATLAQQIASLHEQIRSVTDANAALQGKLKEALSVQPAAVSPAELARAEARIIALEKERDLLAVALDQEKGTRASAVAGAKAAVSQEFADLKARTEAMEKKAEKEAAQANEAAAQSEKKLAAANKELESLKTARTAEGDQNADLKARTEAMEKKYQKEAARANEAAAQSEKKLAAANKELESLKTARMAEGDQNADLKARAEALEKKYRKETAQADEAVVQSEKKLAVANKQLESLKKARMAEGDQNADLKARAEALEKKYQKETAQADEAVVQSEKKLAAANKQLESLKTARAAESGQNADLKARAEALEKKYQKETAQANEAVVQSEKKLAAANKELESLKTARAAESGQNADLKARAEALEKKYQNDAAQATEAAAQSEKKLAVANKELESLKTARAAEAHSAEDAKAVIEERDKLKEELAGNSKDLANAEEHYKQELLTLRTALHQAEQQLNELEQKSAAAPPEQPAREPASATVPARLENPPLAQQMEQPQARIAVPKAKANYPEAPNFKSSIVFNPPVTAIVTCDELSVRGQGSFDGEVITHVKKGQSVAVLEEITLGRVRPNEPDQWSRIVLPANAPVWVDASFIDPETQAVRVKKINVRGGPGENYSILGQLGKGTAVREIGKKEGWLEIEAPANAFAFLASEYLEKQAAATAPAPPPSR